MADRTRSDAVTLLGQLIAFNTESSRSNLALIDHVAARFAALGIAHRVLPSPDGAKANLWAMIGPDVAGGVVLSGHSDVVPVEGQAWDSDPYTMRVAGDRVYGRGAADMKGFLACAIAALEYHRDAPLSRPVHLAISYDEEVGCLGAPALIDWMAERAAPAIVLVGEPTEMRVVNAHKSVTIARTEITGVEAHSSMAHCGASAAELAGRAIAGLKVIEDELGGACSDPRFVPDRTTISVNRMGGGTAVNILAGHAWFEWDVRGIPGAEGDLVLERMEGTGRGIIDPVARLHSGVGMATRVIANVPALAPEPAGEAELLACRLLAASQDASSTVSYGTEAGMFQRAGMSTVVIGPGSMAQGHKANEFVTLGQLAACDAFLDRLIGELKQENK